MPLEAGKVLGPYEILSPIGAGGMGEVYRARDTRLERIVAIKVLPEHVASDPDLKQRFERDAKTVAALSHPHICPVFDVGEQDGINFLVMEYLDGQTLAQRLEKGALPLDQALTVAIEIADALDKAHRQGIVHRDLKPANIMLTKSGAKLLDFGLAKLKPADQVGGLSAMATQSAGLTGEGKILGTLQYMAPEQLEGKEADARTDLFAFGAILYEMVAGRKAFEGKSQASLIAAIMHVDPPAVSTLQSVASTALDHVVKTCLAKDPDSRWQTAGDIGRQLIWITESDSLPSGDVPTSVAAPAQLRVWQRSVPLVLAAVALIVISGLAVWSVTRSAPVVPRVERFVIPPPARENIGVPDNQTIAISPDGTRVVYTVTGNPYQLYVRAIDEVEAIPLEGPNNLAFGPFISPDNAWVGFNDQRDNTLKRVSIRGGPPVTIGRVGAPRTWCASWGTDDTIIFGTNTASGLWRVSANGGEPEALTIVEQDQGQVNHAWPHILPGGQAVLFTILTGTLGSAQIAVLNLDTNEQRVLVPGGSYPRYSPTGHIVYGIGGTVRAVAFDLGRLEVTDPNPVPVLAGVVTKASGAVDFDLADDGSLVYVEGDAEDEDLRVPVWVDREGREELVGLPPRTYGTPRLSPDGTRLAVDILDAENTDVWLSDLARGTLSRLTTDAAVDRAPVWTPDGERVVFASDRDGSWALYWKDPDGTEEPERLVTIEEATQLSPYAWSPNGEMLVFQFQTEGTGGNIGVLTMNGERDWEPLLQTEAWEHTPTISPDGGWIAYSSNESGAFGVYVQRFPGLGDRRQISTSGAAHPLWSPDGREVFYRLADHQMTAVSVEPGETLDVGNAEVLFEDVQYLHRVGLLSYDMSPDGQRFLMLKAEASPDAQDGIRVARTRVLRVMRSHGLLSPHRRRQGAAKTHDGRVITQAPNVLWGTDGVRVFTLDDGWGWIFAAVEHWNAECVGWHVCKVGSRFAALDPIAQGLERLYGSLDADVARGLALRMDHGSQYLSDHFLTQIRYWGIHPSFGFVEEPETNGVVERWNRTLKEQAIHGRIFQNLEAVRVAVADFVVRYNQTWRLEKLGYQTPIEAREEYELRQAA